jgi:hypothetical protein
MHAMRTTTDSICRLTVVEDLAPVQKKSRLPVSCSHGTFYLIIDDTLVIDS